MAKFTFDRSLETGIDRIDAQHRELVKRIEELDLAIYNNTAKIQLVMMLEFLEKYVREHFDAEEAAMMESGYPEFPAHRDEHRKFRDWFLKILHEYKERGADNYLALEMDREIQRWFQNHLKATDAAYVPHIRKFYGK
jgi:hemerythrin